MTSRIETSFFHRVEPIERVTTTRPAFCAVLPPAESLPPALTLVATLWWRANSLSSTHARSAGTPTTHMRPTVDRAALTPRAARACASRSPRPATPQAPALRPDSVSVLRGRPTADARWRPHATRTHAAASPPPSVVLTREAGKNGKLAAALAQRGVLTLELPMVRTEPGEERAALPRALALTEWEWVVVTSPEAASVFVDGWAVAGKPPTRVAVVGAGTGRALLETRGLRVEFTPTLANAVSLGAELPLLPGGTRRVLYPASAKAASTLADTLTARGFEVTRLNTYTSLAVPPGDHPPAALAAASAAPVVALASPSAAKAWAAAVGSGAVGTAAAACIGSTTADAARALGFRAVHAPDAPGLAGFVEAVVEALNGAGVAV